MSFTLILEQPYSSAEAKGKVEVWKHSYFIHFLYQNASLNFIKVAWQVEYGHREKPVICRYQICLWHSHRHRMCFPRFFAVTVGCLEIWAYTGVRLWAHTNFKGCWKYWHIYWNPHKLPRSGVFLFLEKRHFRKCYFPSESIFPSIEGWMCRFGWIGYRKYLFYL